RAEEWRLHTDDADRASGRPALRHPAPPAVDLGVFRSCPHRRAGAVVGADAGGLPQRAWFAEYRRAAWRYHPPPACDDDAVQRDHFMQVRGPLWMGATERVAG